MNPNGRPTTDKKGCTVKVRLNESMRNHLEEYAYTNEKSMSEYIRELILRDMEKSVI